VIDETGSQVFATNRGQAVRIHDLANVDCAAEGGRPTISLFRVERPTVQGKLVLLERHPISSQAFVPLSFIQTIVVVAAAGNRPWPGDIKAFLTDGRQGFSYARGTWHHPLITLTEGTFLVIDRTGPQGGFSQDYEEIDVSSMELSLDVNLVSKDGSAPRSDAR